MNTPLLVLAGKNQQESRRGTILAGYLKLTPVFILLIPGMIAFALFSTHGSGFTTAGHWLYYAEGLQIVCVVLVFAISAFTKAPEPSTVRYTYYGATAEEKTATRASWNHWDVIHSAVIVSVIAVFYYCFW